MAKKKITHFEGLYGDLLAKGKETYIFLELIKTRSVLYDWIIKPHVHPRLCQVFCIQSGNVILETSGNSIALKTPCVVVIPAGIMHGLHYTPDVKGHVLSLSDDVLDSLFASSAALSLHFDELQVINFSKQTKHSFKILQQALAQINTELFGADVEKQMMLRTLLCHFFILLYRFAQTGNSGRMPDTNQTLVYYRKFVQLIKISKSTYTIPQYAHEIGISAVHLNRICKQVCNKPALLLVQEHLIEQSKNYLAHSSYSIAEIAYLLNFEYPNYFARLFKKLNGISPKEYRKTKR